MDEPTTALEAPFAVEREDGETCRWNAGGRSARLPFGDGARAIR